MNPDVTKNPNIFMKVFTVLSIALLGKGDWFHINRLNFGVSSEVPILN